MLRCQAYIVASGRLDWLHLLEWLDYLDLSDWLVWLVWSGCAWLMFLLFPSNSLLLFSTLYVCVFQIVFLFLFDSRLSCCCRLIPFGFSYCCPSLSRFAPPTCVEGKSRGLGASLNLGWWISAACPGQRHVGTLARHTHTYTYTSGVAPWLVLLSERRTWLVK